MFRFGLLSRGNSLPRTGLLLYLPLPNAYLPIDWDEELGWESPMLGYQATPGDDTLFAAAPQLYDGEADTPLILSDTEILALSGINTTVNGVEVSFSVAAGLAVRWHRIAYIPNAYPFVDRDGGSTRLFQDLQYIHLSGAIDFTCGGANGIVGTETVTSQPSGTATITVAAGKLTVGAGDLWSFALSNGSTYEFGTILTATTGVVFDTSGSGRHLLFTVADTSVVCLSGREKGSDWLDEEGWTLSDGATHATRSDGSGLIPENSIIPALLDQSGCASYQFIAPVLQATDTARVMGYTQQLYTNTANDYVMGEFVATIIASCYGVKNPRIVFPNWGVSTGDKVPPNIVRIKAAIDIGGVVTPLTFGGNQIATINPGENITTDTLNTTLAAGTTFYIRCAVEVPDTSGWFYDGAPGVTVCYTARTLGADRVYSTGAMNAPPPDSALNSYGYCPLNILGDMPENAISVGIYGDSIAYGVGDGTTGRVNRDSGYFDRGLREATRGDTPKANYSRANDSLSGLVDAPYRLPLASRHTHCACAMGTNDMGTFPSLNTMKNRYLSVWASLKQQCGYAAQCTILPRQVSKTNLAPWNALYASGGIRDQLNTWFATQVGVTIDALLDVSATVENPTDHTIWDFTGVDLTNDGTHPNYEGHQRMKTVVINWVDSL